MKSAAEYKRITLKNVRKNFEYFRVQKKKLTYHELHWHDCFEIELILSGNGTQEINGIKYEIKKGDIYLLNPTDFHRVFDNTAEAYHIMFSEDFLDGDLEERLLNINKNLFLSLNDAEFKKATTLFASMLEEYEKEDDFSEDYIGNLLKCLFIIIFRNNSEKITQNNTADFKKSILFIHKHFKENPSLSEIAKTVGFSENYFSSYFHKFTGKTYKSYLNILKLEYAKKLLLSGNISVTEICYESGFNSLPNFLRAFKAYFGLSPIKYKNKLKEKV